jgi:two-component system, OmpR family, sensor histidine kinase KdpD
MSPVESIAGAGAPTDAERDASAERFLRLVRDKRRGTLKVYLGLAAGVGKTWRLLQEAHDLLRNGVDVLIGYVETHGRAGTEAQLAGLPVWPRREVFYRGKALAEFDLEGILRRRPAVVVVDELAHSNVPGSTNEKRWQDVKALVAAGISVLTAMNIQHLESLHDQVLRITGIEVSERVSDALLRDADEVVNVDLTVGELLARLREGKIYDPAKVPAALANFFQADKLLQLRELAFREVAWLLGRQIESDAGGAPAVPGERRNADRLLACINANARAAREIIRKASRLANRFGAQAWYVLYVQTAAEAADRIGLAEQRHLIQNFQLATELGGQMLRVKSDDVVTTIRQTAREKNVTLLICGVTGAKTGWERLTRRSITAELVRAVANDPGDLDILLITI